MKPKKEKEEEEEGGRRQRGTWKRRVHQCERLQNLNYQSLNDEGWQTACVGLTSVRVFLPQLGNVDYVCRPLLFHFPYLEVMWTITDREGVRHTTEKTGLSDWRGEKLKEGQEAAAAISENKWVGGSSTSDALVHLKL